MDGKAQDFDFSDFEVHIQKHNDFEEDRPQVDEQAKRPLPCRVDDLDLQSPPGFVGRVADWIDGQCRYPRRRLAVASAIVAIGNIGGMRHKDAREDVTANMLAFCVAGSSTGKEAVMQAFTQLHIHVGMQGAMHGSMKSEQEIMRNVIEQQASFYNIDEIGIFLTKIRKAQKSASGAAYLEGIFGSIMSIYSKASGNLVLGGDTKRDLRKLYGGMLGRAIDDGDEEAQERAEALLRMVDEGLERPFMSLIGYTTPSTFDGVMDGETATQGLVGRAIIVNEKDINPRHRDGFKKADMPLAMGMKLWDISGRNQGEDKPGQVVEWRGDQVKVETTPEADKMLSDVLHWFIDRAEDANEETGPASVAMIRRAYEMVAKISFILSIPHRVRDVDHVRWAFAYVRAETEAKVALVFANDNQKLKPEEALAARILGQLSVDNGKSLSVLSNALKVDKARISEILCKLELQGLVAQKKGKRKYLGQLIDHWFAIERPEG